MELGKLFVGGISWETNEDGLRQYFSQFGEVAEAFIMKDRNTGRGRGFGFVVFTDPSIAERVVLARHTIDGRLVEAKKAVPKDDQQIHSRNNACARESPGPCQSKKIFVGGLPSSITESDFKNYFGQFGTITDVVVMYDQNTKRPRGFGFITYDSEDAVDKSLLRTFHELNGKMVEVKRAVPKELSPSMRSPIGGYNYNVNRVNSFMNGYSKACNLSLLSNCCMSMNGSLGSLASEKTGFPSFGPGIGLGLDYEPTMRSSINRNLNPHSNLEQALSSYLLRNSPRYNGPLPYDGVSGNTSSLFSSGPRNLWGNADLSYATNPRIPNASMALGSGGLDNFDMSSLNWGSSSSSISARLGGSGSFYNNGNLGSRNVDKLDLGGSSFDRSICPPSTHSSASSSGYEGSYPNQYSGNSICRDPTWQSLFSELDVHGILNYRPGNSESDMAGKGFTDYIRGYDVNNSRPDKGIAT